MSTTYKLPTEMAVSNLLELLVGKTVKVKKGVALDQKSALPLATGVYVNQEDKIGALCQVDFELANYAGAALSMVPAAVANESIKAGESSEAISANLYEILNICVGFFNVGEVPHIRLSDVRTSQKALPEDIETFCSGDVKRLDLEVDVAGYGSGKMALIAG